MVSYKSKAQPRLCIATAALNWHLIIAVCPSLGKEFGVQPISAIIHRVSSLPTLRFQLNGKEQATSAKRSGESIMHTAVQSCSNL